MYCEYSKIRQTTHPEHRTLYSARGEKSVEHQSHRADNYTIVDIKSERPSKGKKPSKKKKQGQKQSSQKKKAVSFSVGSAEHHGISLQKLQLAVGDKNKQKINLIIETQRLKNENNLMMLQILMPRDNKEAEYIRQLEEKDQKLKILNLVQEEAIKKMEDTLLKLEKQKKKYERQFAKLEDTKILRR